MEPSGCIIDVVCIGRFILLLQMGLPGPALLTLLPLLLFCRDCFKWGYPDLLRLMSNNVTQWAALEPTMFSDLHKKLAVVLSVTTAAGVDGLGGRDACVFDGIQVRDVFRNMNGCRVDVPFAPQYALTPLQQKQLLECFG